MATLKSNLPRATGTTASRGFTLIELLVVIAIIALLVSILVPSIRHALHLAKFTLCKTNLKAMGTGLAIYTGDNEGFYPSRTIIGNGLGGPDSLKRGDLDDRPKFETYMDLDQVMLCPLAPAVPEGFSFSQSTQGSILSCYEIWAGYRLVYDEPSTEMGRVNDYVKYNGMRFAILAADFERKAPVWTEWGSCHLDSKALMRDQWVYNDNGYTVSHYYNLATMERGLLDRNFVYVDGGVRSLMDLEMDDPRTVEVPWYTHPNTAYSSCRALLPPMQAGP